MLNRFNEWTVVLIASAVIAVAMVVVIALSYSIEQMKLQTITECINSTKQVIECSVAMKIGF